MIKKNDIQEIENPKDIFGKEILPEITFESQYGKLTFSRVIIPDFSKNERAFDYLKEDFLIITSITSVKDLLYKWKKVKLLIFFYYNYQRYSDEYFSFIDILKANIKARLLESGNSSCFTVCREFGYEKSARLCSGQVKFNDIPIYQPLASTGGLYLYILRYILIEFKGFWIHKGFVEKIKKNNELPKNNYISWAFYSSLRDYEILKFSSSRNLSLVYFEEDKDK